MKKNKENKKSIYVRCESRSVNPGDEGNALDIVGEIVSSVDKVDAVPSGLNRCTEETGCLMDIYTKKGVKLAYDENSFEDDDCRKLKPEAQKSMNKEWVSAAAMYFKDNEDGTEELYLEMDEDSYGKLVYLFRKEGQLYRLSY